MMLFLNSFIDVIFSPIGKFVECLALAWILRPNRLNFKKYVDASKASIVY